MPDDDDRVAFRVSNFSDNRAPYVTYIIHHPFRTLEATLCVIMFVRRYVLAFYADAVRMHASITGYPLELRRN